MMEEPEKSPEEEKEAERPAPDTAETSGDAEGEDPNPRPEEGAEEEKPEEPKEEKPKGPESSSGKEIDEVTTLHERTIAALSYVGFLAIIPFYLKKDSKFCRFHGKQGLLIAMIFFFAKLLLVLDLLMDIALILQFVIFVYMGLAALSGRWKKFPWIYKRACQLEEQLSLKTKEEMAEEEALKAEEAK